jgi:hypothetical protein
MRESLVQVCCPRFHEDLSTALDEALGNIPHLRKPANPRPVWELTSDLELWEAPGPVAEVEFRQRMRGWVAPSVLKGLR